MTYKFSSSNLDFNELLEKYKLLNTTYDDTTDLKIDIYENCNLLQNLTTSFTVPSTNIRLSSFKNNYIMFDTQTLDLNQAFYGANEGFFTTFVDGDATYINNINLTNIIKTHFDYTNSAIYPSKKIIINIDLPNEIVALDNVDDSGALQIDMKEIKEHFHSLFDTLELDIKQYVTGKHGGLENTDLQPSNRTGGKGQNGLPGGPAINITNNDSSYFNLIIKTNSLVSGGFGASGGDGGNGIIDAKSADDNMTNVSTGGVVGGNSYVIYKISYKKSGGGRDAEWLNTYEVISALGHLVSEYNRPGGYEELVFPTANYALRADEWDNGFLYEWLNSIFFGTSSVYIPKPDNNPDPDEYITQEFITVAQLPSSSNGIVRPINTTSHPDYSFAVFSKWTYKIRRRTYTKIHGEQPTIGNEGNKANYIHKVNNPFPSQDGNDGTANNGQGGAGGAKGNTGGITSITATNIIIDP